MNVLIRRPRGSSPPAAFGLLPAGHQSGLDSGMWSPPLAARTQIWAAMTIRSRRVAELPD
jgi:hypothetical protein